MLVVVVVVFLLVFVVYFPVCNFLKFVFDCIFLVIAGVVVVVVVVAVVIVVVVVAVVVLYVIAICLTNGLQETIPTRWAIPRTKAACRARKRSGNLSSRKPRPFLPTTWCLL